MGAVSSAFENQTHLRVEHLLFRRLGLPINENYHAALGGLRDTRLLPAALPLLTPFSLAFPTLGSSRTFSTPVMLARSLLATLVFARWFAPTRARAEGPTGS
jgi:hypothetical protein